MLKSRKPTHESHDKAAFTLIELLVVISIVALLISILLPALASARKTAQAIQCATNLKGFGTANAIYAGDNHGWQVPNRAWGEGNGLITNGQTGDNAQVEWFNIIGFRQAMNFTMAISGDKWYSAPLSSVCPNAMYAQGAVNADGYTRMNYTYGQSIMLNSGKAASKAAASNYPNLKMRALRDTLIIKPAEKLFFADAVSGNLTQLDSIDYIDESTLLNNAMAYRHPGDSANVAFFDGHVQRMPYEQISVVGFSTFHQNWGPYDQ
ncbi:MAG: prepilin-type N-terminal cleavage/methylation domain-containing protein [Phycisphaeraceae bacterium JB051]